MVNYLALTGAAVSSTVCMVACLALVAYLLMIAAYRGFFRHYTVLYMYLFTTMMVTGMGALFLVFFDRNSDAYFTVFYFSKAPLTLFKFLVVCWLYWLILSTNYPSVRFGFMMVFLVTVAVFLLYFASIHYPHGAHLWDRVQHVTRYIDKYFTTAQVLLLAVLSVIIYAFRLSINRHLMGITLGLGSSFALKFLYDVLKQSPWLHTVTYFYMGPYLVMLIIFCFYLSKGLNSYGQCTNPGLKNVDERLFQLLLSAHLYNRVTDRLFFGYFDFQTAHDFERWKHYKTNLRAKATKSATRYRPQPLKGTR